MSKDGKIIYWLNLLTRSWVPWFADFVIRRRFLILGFCIILLGISIKVIVTDYRLAQNLKDDLPVDDPDIVFMNEFVETFGGYELLVIGIETDDVFTKEILDYVDLLTGKVEKIENIQEVVSLTNILEIHGENDEIIVEPLISQKGVPSDPKELSQIKERALSNKFWINSLVSKDGKACAINMKLPILQDDATFRFQIVSDIRQMLSDKNIPPPPGASIYFTGVSVFGKDALEAMEDDLFNYFWLIPLMILVLLFVVFRTLRGVLVPQVVIFLSVAYTLALLFATGKSITMISTMLPVLIAVIAISDVIHVIARYYEQSQFIRDKNELVRSTIIHMLPPCFLTSTTTAAGFGSLMISDVTQVKDFGFFAAVGLMASFFVAMTIAPIILSMLPLPKQKVREAYAEGFFNRLLTHFDRITTKDKVVIPTIAVLVLFCAAFGIYHLKVETTMAKFLPKDKPSVTGLNWLQDKMAGVTTLEMMISGEEGVFKEPWALEEVRGLSKYLESLYEVNKVYSIVDFITTFNKVLHNDNPDFEKIPPTQKDISQYLLLFESTDGQETLEDFVLADYSTTRVTARIRSMGSASHLELIEHVNKYVETRLDKRLKLRTTGVVVLYATLTTALVKGQIYSLIIAFFVIIIMMMIHLRSIKIGLLSMIPNIFPLAVTLGLMGIMDISLNVATVMISCIALGIAVDDTIHYLSRYGAELEEGKSLDQAMHRTIMGAGRGMIFTSLVITGGFFALCFSSFQINKAFGILTGITMITAVFADLLLLPVLIRIFRIRR